MTTTPSLTVYTLDCCPHCDLLKTYLKEKGAPYTEEDMSSAESLTELRVNGVFVNEAPVLRKGDTFLTTYDLFSSGKVNTGAVDAILSGD
ncbi:MAG: glutaredoxin family protein [Methanoregulaceae archaeon]